MSFQNEVRKEAPNEIEGDGKETHNLAEFESAVLQAFQYQNGNRDTSDQVVCSPYWPSTSK